ncbi:hypothetical protein NliqN6_1343 [Naganishia liquefaciens]|uniref:SGNH hydrolase-type esterase domain-containing protein n=1 Tax=Naganishia liquefaciens TaxID=104408 RepID=A0A8H3YEP2_9TREE|nr:hypothetical protein NliqN6_1343 [Naganishia liquefaciens]
MPLPRKSSPLRTAYYLIFSLLITANVVFIASRFRTGTALDHGGIRVLERKDHQHVEERSTALTRPSVSCDLCPGSDDFCIDLGYYNIAHSIAHEGTNARLHRLFRKLESGMPISMGVIGGSVSAGHGLSHDGDTDEMEGPLNMHRQIFDWIATKWPHPEHRFSNGAIPASGSLYFATCFAEHMDEDVDLVMIELGVNDVQDITVQMEYELLLRGILALPNKPAIINLQTIGLIFDALSQGGDQQLGVSQYYDVPTITIRSLILPIIFNNYRDAERFFTLDSGAPADARWEDTMDLRHLNRHGHSAMSNLTRVYFERQLCKMTALDSLEQQGYQPKHSAPHWPGEDLVTQVPAKLLTSRYDKDEVVPPFKPQCLSTASKKHPLVPDESFGWTHWNWKDKKYLVGRVPGAKFSISVTTSLGEIKVYYQRSAKYGLGQVDCWVDRDLHSMKRLDGYWTHDYSIVESTMIASGLKPGKHVLHCEVVADTNDPVSGGHEFRITSVTTL